MYGVTETADGSPPHLELRGVCKTLGGRTVLDHVDLEVAKGDLLGLLGPSGSGKTTMLNMIGGFLSPDSGTVRIAGQDIVGVQPHRRDIGITFQGYALFPHLTVFDNVAFGLKQRGAPKPDIKSRVAEMLALLGLSGYETRLPRALSGGEQQRVALARALVVRPRLMLLDEPLANLDAALRHRVRFEIREVLRRTQVTSIFVTHDQDEAFALCDRVAVLNQGRIQQIGTPADLILEPANAFVAGFIGSPNMLTGRTMSYDEESNRATVDINGFTYAVNCKTRVAPGTPLTIFVRPEEVTISPATSGGGPFQVKDWVYLGSGREMWVDGPAPLRVRLPNDAQGYERGERVTLSWRPERAHAFPADAESRATADHDTAQVGR
jgi:ABC-type Fe3+/spermidine/putrescine transport system ATPase subunit